MDRVDVRIPIRWLGFTLMNVGEIGNFLSYGFAPASVVAPLGAVSFSYHGCLSTVNMIRSLLSLLTVSLHQSCYTSDFTEQISLV